MIQILTYNEINKQQWQLLTEQSATATWFQTPEAYEFYASLPAEMQPFTVGVENQGELRAVCVGYVTQEPNAIKQYLTCRAIVVGGPVIANDATNEEVAALLKAIRRLGDKAIYVETRNFNNYSRWKSVFEANGFAYQPHLNFHIDTTSVETAKANIGKHRWKYIRLSIRDGATMVENPTLEQVHECYELLKELYSTRVKTPLFSWEFFEKLYSQPNAKYLLVEFEGKILGGTICVCLPGKALYEWFVCGNDYYRKGIRPSSVATWYGIQYAAQNGYPRFDLMGAGKPDEPYGVRDFKAEFGGELVEHGRFLYIRKLLLYRIGKLGVKILKRR
jgi:lipid II:glycine glycyltransferase (peptidoglycan interpeptide bridge formation enzyme)